MGPPRRRGGRSGGGREGPGQQRLASMGPPRRRGGRSASSRYLSTRGARASMGPPRRRGERGHRRSCGRCARSRFNGAAPSSRRKAQGPHGYRSAAALPASMGPPRRRGGREPCMRRVDRGNLLLQWGRPVVEAKSAFAPSPVMSRTRSLQRGRPVVEAEGAHLYPHLWKRAVASVGPPRRRGGRLDGAAPPVLVGLLASMGPPRRRGGRMDYLRKMADAYEVLQWGRPVVEAEGSESSRSSSA